MLNLTNKQKTIIELISNTQNNVGLDLKAQLEFIGDKLRLDEVILAEELLKLYDLGFVINEWRLQNKNKLGLTIGGDHTIVILFGGKIVLTNISN